MARLDLGGLRDLWYRIDDIFARITEAAGSIALSGTSLVLSSVAGGTLSTVDLDGTFATDAEAAHSLEASGFKLTLKSVTGAVLTSALDLTAQAKTALNNYFGRKLSWTSSTGKLALQGNDGTELDSVTISVPSTSGLADESWVRRSFMASAGISVSGSTFTITFYDGDGNYQDSVSFTVN